MNKAALAEDGYAAGHKAGYSEAEGCLAALLGIKPDPDAAELVADQIKGALEKLDWKRRKSVMKELRKLQGKEMRKIEAKQKTLTAQREFLDRMKVGFLELQNWVPDRPVLERPGGSVSHHLRQEILDGSALIFTNKPEDMGATLEYERELFNVAQFFVVDHDWAAAFANAGDYADGIEFKLPADVCVFEFKVSGKSVAMIVAEADGVMFYEIMARSIAGWIAFSCALRLDVDHKATFADGTKDPFAILAKFLRPQIKAICVALEAEVAETETIRAPHKLNHAREKAGRALLSDYHVVQLSRRARGTPRDLPVTGEVKGVRRLHFRRGHWRHFETHKTWIRWMLVGNPDLGFVDKEYRV